MTSTTETPTPFPIILLAPVAEALGSPDRQVRAEAFARLAEEALELAKQSGSQEMFQFWGGLHEDCHAEARDLLEPAPKPKGGGKKK